MEFGCVRTHAAQLRCPRGELPTIKLGSRTLFDPADLEALKKVKKLCAIWKRKVVGKNWSNRGNNKKQAVTLHVVSPCIY